MYTMSRNEAQDWIRKYEDLQAAFDKAEKKAVQMRYLWAAGEASKRERDRAIKTADDLLQDLTTFSPLYRDAKIYLSA